jgi:hypothetical protein
VRYLRGTSSVMERLTVTITGPAVEVTRRFSSGSSGNRSLRAAAFTVLMVVVSVEKHQ